MSKTHLIIPDCHALPGTSHERADYLAQLIIDVRPDVVIQIGDAADMESLCSYDKGKRSFQGRSYKKDLEAHLEFQDRLWYPVQRRKKRMPYRVALIGNHEHRIERALDLSPELEGTIGLNDLEFSSFYDTVVPYEGDTPGVVVVDGIHYAHFFISGIMGRGIGGEHSAYTLLTKNFQSCTQGHSHVIDFCERSNADGQKIMGMVCGAYIDYKPAWAGERTKLWWNGVVVKRNVEKGVYDPQFISLDWLRKEYGGK